MTRIVYDYPDGIAIFGEIQSPQGYIRRQQWSAPLAASAAYILSAQSLASGGTATTFVHQPDFPRNLTVVASGSATGNVVVTGTNIRGEVITETLALNGTTPVPGAKAFASVASVALPTVSATTINLGIGVKFGLDRCMSEASVVNAYTDGVRETTAPTVGFDSDEVEKNTMSTNTAPNGTHNFSAFFMATELTEEIGTTS